MKINNFHKINSLSSYFLLFENLIKGRPLVVERLCYLNYDKLFKEISSPERFTRYLI